MFGGAPFGDGAFGEDGEGSPSGSASVTGFGSVETAGTGEHFGSSAVSGSGAIAAAGTKAVSGAASVSGGGSVTAAGSAHGGPASVSGSGSVAAVGKKQAYGAAAITGSGSTGSVIAQGAQTFEIEQEWVFVDGSVIEQEWIFDARFLEFIEQEWVFSSDIRTVLEQEWVFDSPILDYDVLEVELVIVSPILGASAQIVTDVPTATIRGQVIPIEQGSVSFDQGQFAWTCQLTLADPRHWQLFRPDDAFTVNLPGEDYAFLVDDVSFSRAGQVARTATVAGVGPSARYSSPRAQKISRTWDEPVLATAVVEELFGAGVVQWEILDWAIPAFRLGMQDQVPMDVLQRLAAAPGATVQSEPNGTLRVRYLNPVSVPLYADVTPNHEYFDAQHNFTSETRFSPAQLVDRLRILDVEPGAGRDTIEFEQDPQHFTRGTLRVFPSPWRTDVRVEHTSDARVSAALVGEETEELTETVEVIGGKGSVSKPIYQVIELEWLYADLSGVAFELDATAFSTTHPTLTETLLRITYTTRFIAFEASAFPEAEVQFLVLEEA